MKHLILGSRGQVGSYVARAALSYPGSKVIEWDILISKDHDLRVGSNKLTEAMEECDYVHFLAYNVGGSKYLASNQDSFDFIQDNIDIMGNVFSAIKHTKKPFYFASSQMSTMGHSTYGKLKAIGESYTRALGGTVVWFWNVYGKETDLKKSHVITDFIRMAKDNGEILCRTDGTELRQFLYAGDVSNILMDLAYGHLYTQGEDPFEITSGQWIPIKTVAETIGEIFDVPVYFSNKKDQIQGILNEPTTKLPFRSFTSLKSGIQLMLK